MLARQEESSLARIGSEEDTDADQPIRNRGRPFSGLFVLFVPFLSKEVSWPAFE